MGSWWYSMVDNEYYAGPGKRVFYKPQLIVVQFDFSTKRSGFIHQVDLGYANW